MEQRKLSLHKVLDGLLDSFLDVKIATNLAQSEEDIFNIWKHLKTKFVIDEKETEKEDAPAEPAEQEDASSTGSAETDAG